jgi:NAD(P)H dehydrogenase (quinone)
LRVHIVYAHPEPTSFSAALRDRAVATVEAGGHEATVSDLFGEGFNPVAGRHDFTTVADPGRFHYQTEQEHAARHGGFAPDIAREQARLAAADVLVLVFPVWWGGVPAILKGWMDRVLAYGFAYVDGRRFDTGVFKGRRALFGVTTGGTPERFSETGVYGPIERVLYPSSARCCNIWASTSPRPSWPTPPRA